LLIAGEYYRGAIMVKNIEKEYVRFYNSDLIGVVETVGIKYHGSSFRLKGDNEGYVFILILMLT
jgi:hypothetical protein